MGSWIMDRPDLETRKWIRLSPYFPDIHTQKDARYLRRLAFLHDNLYSMESLNSARALDRLYQTSADGGGNVYFPRLKRHPLTPKNDEELSPSRSSKKPAAQKPKPFFLTGNHMHVCDGKMYGPYGGLNLPRDCNYLKINERMRLEILRQYERSQPKGWIGKSTTTKEGIVYISPMTSKMFLRPQVEKHTAK
ncbi:uncharacterized protein LOC121387544 isoform X2 [Gigantopelta aegis]|uniref:uncharacterized protein LOC121387544 isoform X2 n=1 Tax=Gigantopelta aegis TaxID=1735272 RepID=UPI001B88AC5B|nr:uncharacterized protein LOC121387544 isoform X2 [Gigantopelta aegis]